MSRHIRTRQYPRKPPRRRTISLHPAAPRPSRASSLGTADSITAHNIDKCNDESSQKWRSAFTGIRSKHALFILLQTPVREQTNQSSGRLPPVELIMRRSRHCGASAGARGLGTLFPIAMDRRRRPAIDFVALALLGQSTREFVPRVDDLGGGDLVLPSLRCNPQHLGCKVPQLAGCQPLENVHKA